MDILTVMKELADLRLQLNYAEALRTRLLQAVQKLDNRNWSTETISMGFERYWAKHPINMAYIDSVLKELFKQVAEDAYKQAKL